MQKLTKRCVKDVSWYVPAGQEVTLEGLKSLADFSDGAGVAVLKKGRRKSFIQLEDTLNGKEVYLKVFRLKGIFQRLKHRFFKSKARKELEVSLAAQERGIPVVLPLAAGERRCNGLLQESYLLIQRLPRALDLLEYLRRRDTTHGQKVRVIDALGRLSRKTHDAGILQEDFSLNNFLLAPYHIGAGLANPQDSRDPFPFSMEAGNVTPPITKMDDNRVFLIDFERAGVKQKLSTKEKEWTLAKLNRIGANFTLTDKFRFLRAYCNNREELTDLPRWKKLEKYTYQILRRDAQRISTACISAGRGYKLYKDDRLRGYFLEGYHLDELLNLIQTGQEIQEGHRGEFNVSRRRVRIRKGGIEETVMVYEFNSRQKGLALATKAWQATNGLLKGYFPVSPTVAAIEWIQYAGYRGTLLLKEWKKAEDIRYTLDPPKADPASTGRRHSILWHTARFLSRLHNFGTFADGIFPGDISWVEGQAWGRKLLLTQPCNFVVKKRLNSSDREIDMERLETYLEGILTKEEKDYLREQYLRYSNVIS